MGRKVGGNSQELGEKDGASSKAAPRNFGLCLASS